MPEREKLRGIVSVLLSLLLLSIVLGVSNAQGPTVIIWAAANALSERAAAEPGTGWGRAQLIEAPDARLDFDPQVAVDPQGAAVAVWHHWEGPGYDLWANRFVPGVGWGTAELLETDESILRGAQIAVDPQGNATAVWRQSDGTRDNIWANRFVPGVGWGTAELIETDAGNATTPQVATDPQGNAIAVWSQGDGTRDNIWANRFAEEIVSPGLAISPFVVAAGIGVGVVAVAAVAALLILRSRGKRKEEG